MSDSSKPCLKFTIFRITPLLYRDDRFHKGFLKNIFRYILIMQQKHDIRKYFLLTTIQ